MAITSETYDPIKIDKLKLYLQTQAERNAPRYYEIYVDNLKAVHKTVDLQEFDSFEDYMTDDTERIRILVYTTNFNSPRNDQYSYRMKKLEEHKQITHSQGLSGIELENKIEEKLLQQRERLDYNAIVKKLTETETQLKESEEYAEKLEKELLEYKSKKLHWGNVNLGEFASVVVEGFVRRNPQMLTKLPGGEALAGIIEQDNRERGSTTPTTETEVSFKKKSDTTELTEEEKSYLNFMKGVAESFDEEEIIILTHVITKLEEDTSQLKPVAELLNINVTGVLKNETKN